MTIHRAFPLHAAWQAIAPSIESASPIRAAHEETSMSGTSARVERQVDPMAQLAINTIRTLSMDAVQAANSGHPGTPMALAPVAYCLWQKFLRFDPEDPI